MCRFARRGNLHQQRAGRWPTRGDRLQHPGRRDANHRAGRGTARDYQSGDHRRHESARVFRCALVDLNGSALPAGTDGLEIDAPNTSVRDMVISGFPGNAIDVASVSQVSIEGSLIYGNGGLGIDLGADGVTANTGSTNSALPNDGMNFPVFTAANLSGNSLTLAGYVGSAANQTAFANARVEVFESDNNASGYGGGQMFLGSLTTDANGNFSGTLTVGGLTAGQLITATATDPTGNTSEFSADYAVDAPPTVTTAAATTPSPATGTTASLSVGASSPLGAGDLTYTWASTGTPPAPVSFSDNGTNAASNTTVTFSTVGTYAFQVTIADSRGFSTTSNVSVTVVQALSSIVVTPGSVVLNETQSQQFSATAYDQFGHAMLTQPVVAWAVTSGAGSITAGGLYSCAAGHRRRGHQRYQRTSERDGLSNGDQQRPSRHHRYAYLRSEDHPGGRDREFQCLAVEPAPG